MNIEINKSRPWRAGEMLGKAIIEMINLMYQKRTALSFLKALCIELNSELDKREKIK